MAVGVSTQVAPVEEVCGGAVDALLLGPRHGVAADEAGVVHRGHERGLHAADIGDDPVTGVEQPPGLGGDRTDGRGDDRQVRGRVLTHRVERAVGHRGLSPVGVAVRAQ